MIFSYLSVLVPYLIAVGRARAAVRPILHWLA